MTLCCLQSEEELQRVVDEFYRIYIKRKLNVNVEKSEVIVFERRKVEVADFDTLIG